MLKFYNTIRPGKPAGDPVMSDISALRFLPDETVQYKLKFDDSCTVLPETMNTRNQHSVCFDAVEPLYSAPIKTEI